MCAKRESQMAPTILKAAVRSCDRCGQCEAVCPYGLVVVQTLQDRVPVMEDIVRIFQELLHR